MLSTSAAKLHDEMVTLNLERMKNHIDAGGGVGGAFVFAFAAVVVSL